MKKYFPATFCIALILSAANVFATPKDSTLDNELSKQEKKDGWKLLFNGKSLDDFRIYKNETGSSWKVVDGTICSTKPEGDKNPDLITEGKYESFELQIDWKLSPKGNSGIMYHVTEDYDHSYES